jgi:hypothetical protein
MQGFFNSSILSLFFYFKIHNRVNQLKRKNCRKTGKCFSGWHKQMLRPRKVFCFSSVCLSKIDARAAFFFISFSFQGNAFSRNGEYISIVSKSPLIYFLRLMLNCVYWVLICIHKHVTYYFRVNIAIDFLDQARTFSLPYRKKRRWRPQLKIRARWPETEYAFLPKSSLQLLQYSWVGKEGRIRK